MGIWKATRSGQWIIAIVVLCGVFWMALAHGATDPVKCKRKTTSTVSTVSNRSHVATVSNQFHVQIIAPAPYWEKAQQEMRAQEMHVATVNLLAAQTRALNNNQYTSTQCNAQCGNASAVNGRAPYFPPNYSYWYPPNLGLYRFQHYGYSVYQYGPPPDFYIDGY